MSKKVVRKIRRDYFGLSYLVSVILAIIPFTSWILGAITRFEEGHWILGLIRLIGGFNVIWIIDLISMIFTKKIFRIVK